MKIVQINANYNRSSIGRTTSELHKWLLEHGHDSYVFTSQEDASDNHVYHIGNQCDHKIHGLISRLLGLQGYASYFATRRMIRQLHLIDPDVVHLRNLHGNYINLPLLFQYLSKNNVNTVVTNHDCWLMTGHCTHPIHHICEKWYTGCHHCPAMKFDNVSWLFDTSRKCYNDKKKWLSGIERIASVGNSQWTTEQIRNSYMKNVTIVEHIYNWIDDTVFYPRETVDIRKRLGLSDNDFIILGVCDGWAENKGLSIFGEIAQRVPRWKIVLVGGVAHGAVVPAGITMVDKTHNNDELCEYYTMADVLINPSKAETFGKVSAEALCCGTPVIVNNATANPEIVGPGCGFVVEDNNLEQYVQYIVHIETQGKSAYSATCIDFAHKQFNKEAIILQYVGLYNRMLNIKVNQ
ncbi:glycosyltransferase [Bacteroides nordii]|uniref:glycosyltransferase n=1 Tax=Bacteroides nordii TaxID=291645 RepID=UPI0020424A78|nr:glycosyltransferase [Bacteroides nordii]